MGRGARLCPHRGCARRRRGLTGSGALPARNLARALDGARVRTWGGEHTAPQPCPARQRGDARRRAGDAARAVLRPRVRARAHPVHDADGKDAHLGGPAQGPARARHAVVVVGRLRVADERRRPRGGGGAPGDVRRDGRVPRSRAVRARRVRLRGAAVRVRVRGGACRAHRAVHARQPRRREAAPFGDRTGRQHGDRRRTAVRGGVHVRRGCSWDCGASRWCSTWAGRSCSAPRAGSSCPATSQSATARS